MKFLPFKDANNTRGGFFIWEKIETWIEAKSEIFDSLDLKGRTNGWIRETLARVLTRSNLVRTRQLPENFKLNSQPKKFNFLNLNISLIINGFHTTWEANFHPYWRCLPLFLSLNNFYIFPSFIIIIQTIEKPTTTIVLGWSGRGWFMKAIRVEKAKDSGAIHGRWTCRLSELKIESLNLQRFCK